MDFPNDPIETAQKIEWLLSTAKKMWEKLSMRKAKQLSGSTVELEASGIYLVEKQAVVVIVGLGNWSSTPDTAKSFALDLSGHVLQPDHPGNLEVRGIDWWHRFRQAKVRVDGHDFEQGALFFPVDREVHEFMRTGPVHATFKASMFRNGALRAPIELDARESFALVEARSVESRTEV